MNILRGVVYTCLLTFATIVVLSLMGARIGSVEILVLLVICAGLVAIGLRSRDRKTVGF